MRKAASSSFRRGFSLVEVLTVLVVIGILLAIAIPTLHTPKLSTSGRAVSDMMMLARAQAISNNTIARFVVATESDDDSQPYRMMSVWLYDKEAEEYRISEGWTRVTDGVVFEPEAPDYLGNAAYAEKDPSVVRGDYFLGSSFPEWEIPKSDEESDTESQMKGRYFEFRPNGDARIKNGDYRTIQVVLCEGFFKNPSSEDSELIYTSPEKDGGRPKNWEHVVVDTLTGRIQLLSP